MCVLGYNSAFSIPEISNLSAVGSERYRSRNFPSVDFLELKSNIEQSIAVSVLSSLIENDFCLLADLLDFRASGDLRFEGSEEVEASKSELNDIPESLFSESEMSLSSSLLGEVFLSLDKERNKILDFCDTI